MWSGSGPLRWMAHLGVNHVRGVVAFRGRMSGSLGALGGSRALEQRQGCFRRLYRGSRQRRGFRSNREGHAHALAPAGL